ncbi:MAG: hypothetical protein A2X49_07645 [Lentisphaerae bacterium GWF2_52_8]|nr:MAG: hypothetical protein A2X49_07645 [Lentisphaerae bacterium GWF2_52_8]
MIELMLVIAIIVILAGLLLPSLKKAHEIAKRIKCTGNERQLHLAWSNYCTDYNGFLPVYDTALWGDTMWVNSKAWTFIMRDSLMPAVASAGIDWNSYLSCPNLPQSSRYAGLFNPALGMTVFGIGGGTCNGSKKYVKLSNISLPSQSVAFGDSNLASSGAPSIGGYRLSYGLSMTNLRHLGKNNILFCDGHVESKDRYFFNPPWGWWNLAPWGNP